MEFVLDTPVLYSTFVPSKSCLKKARNFSYSRRFNQKKRLDELAWHSNSLTKIFQNDSDF
jgi:hypothetical protein